MYKCVLKIISRFNVHQYNIEELTYFIWNLSLEKNTIRYVRYMIEYLVCKCYEQFDVEYHTIFFDWPCALGTCL